MSLSLTILRMIGTQEFLFHQSNRYRFDTGSFRAVVALSCKMILWNDWYLVKNFIYLTGNSWDLILLLLNMRVNGFGSTRVVLGALSNSARCKSKEHFTALKESVKCFSIGKLSCFVFAWVTSANNWWLWF